MIYLEPYHFITNYNKKELEKLDKKINIIYRNYKDPIKINTILKIKNQCNKSGRKMFLSNNIELARRLKLNGAYIPSFNKSLNFKYKKSTNFQLLGSAHNLSEIKIKEKQGVNIIFLSPLFKVNKSNSFLGIYRFNIFSNYTKKKIVALGGINKKNIKKLKLLNCDGYASITYLKQQQKINDVRK